MAITDTEIATYPLQAYLFAHLIQVFTLTGSDLVSKGNFWALMFFILACGTGIAYFVMGWAGHLVSIVSPHQLSTVKTGNILTLFLGSFVLLPARIYAQHFT
jgi:hypothetical protein